MNNPDPRSKEGRAQRRKEQQQKENPIRYNQPPKQEEVQTPIQANYQMADDTWERLLCALERLEYVTEQAQIERSATRLDRHQDRNNIQVSVEHAQEEVNLQVSAFWYVVKPVRDKNLTIWLLKDFICWLGGREKIGLQFNITDRYVIPVIDCILGVPYKSINLPEPKSQSSLQNYGSPSRETITNAAEQLGAALGGVDKLVNDFVTDPSKKATQHHHERGNVYQGMQRVNDICNQLHQGTWFNRFSQEWGSRLQ